MNNRLTSRLPRLLHRRRSAVGRPRRRTPPPRRLTATSLRRNRRHLKFPSRLPPSHANVLVQLSPLNHPPLRHLPLQPLQRRSPRLASASNPTSTSHNLLSPRRRRALSRKRSTRLPAFTALRRHEATVPLRQLSTRPISGLSRRRMRNLRRLLPRRLLSQRRSPLRPVPPLTSLLQRQLRRPPR